MIRRPAQIVWNNLSYHRCSSFITHG